VTGQETVPRGVLHSPEAILPQQREREAAKAAALVERESKAVEVEERRVVRDAEDARRALVREHIRCMV